MGYQAERGTAFDMHGSESSFTTVSATAATLGPYKIPTGCRRLAIAISYNANATPGGIIELVPMITDQEKTPLVTADVWTVPGVWDGTVTPGAGVTVASGIDWTTSPNFGQVVHTQLALRTPTTTGASDKVRVRFSINVEDGTWVAFQIKEVSANTGSAWIRGRFYV